MYTNAQHPQPSGPSPVGAGPFVVVDGRVQPWVPSQEPAGVPVGSTFSGQSAQVSSMEGPFIIVDGVIRPYAVASSGPATAPVGSGPYVIVNGATLPYPVPSADGDRSSRPAAPSWQAVAITAIISGVVVTCMMAGMEIAAIIAAVALIIMMGNQVRVSLTA